MSSLVFENVVFIYFAKYYAKRMDMMNIYTWLMLAVFFIGYLLITLEHYTHINKATVALLMAVTCWVLQFLSPAQTKELNLTFLGHHIANISQVIFFLLGALTIVETINVHQGFNVIADLIQSRSKRRILWIFGAVSFVFSAVLDNLTTTVVMITLLNKIVKKSEDKWLIGGGVVIAANAGGAWTPIGDVTTTMLWIGGQVSTLNIMKQLFFPSLICVIVSFVFLTPALKGSFPEMSQDRQNEENNPLGKFVFYLGVALLVFVPVFKILTGLPPFMGMLLGLGVMWLITDILHYEFPEKNQLRVPYVLTKIDLAGTLFFLGILLCIDALDTAGLLGRLAVFLDQSIANVSVIASTIGLASAVIDNVPLVAASMGMYSLEQYPADNSLWVLIAFCAGTGGSILLIGSAAGVVFMGMEQVDFFWYIKRISLSALIGYFAGIGVYLLLS